VQSVTCTPRASSARTAAKSTGRMFPAGPTSVPSMSLTRSL
jgi:hypothetical protein